MTQGDRRFERLRSVVTVALTAILCFVVAVVVMELAIDLWRS